MTDRDRRERTAKVLIARLDALAKAAACLPHAEAARLIERAAVATRHAVTLELLDADRAAGIWQDAHARYPDLPRAELELPLRRAA